SGRTAHDNTAQGELSHTRQEPRNRGAFLWPLSVAKADNDGSGVTQTLLARVLRRRAQVNVICAQDEPAERQFRFSTP
ncbi:hypothetical protein B5K06_14745, partial [Rhizobium grahamii]